MISLNRRGPGGLEIDDMALSRVQRYFPDLTDFGIGIYEAELRGSQRIAKVKERQAFLFNECKEEIALSLRFLHCLTPLATAQSHSPTSYYLKHVMEDIARGLKLPQSYVCNGAFIAAAVIAGYPVMRVDEGSPNVRVGVSRKEIRAFIALVGQPAFLNFLEARDLE